LVSKRLVEPGKLEVDLIAGKSLHPEIASVVCWPVFEPAARSPHPDLIIEVCPEIEPEWALWVVGEGKVGYSVVSTEFDYVSVAEEFTTPGWIDSTDVAGMLDWLDSLMRRALKKHVKPLPIEAAAAVCDVWSKVLFLTRYRETQFAECDGTTYHFGHSKRGSAPMAGKTWSPPEETVPGKLVSLSRLLRECVRDAGPSDDRIIQKIDEHVTSIRIQLDDMHPG
jgi:hypothetical protein